MEIWTVSAKCNTIKDLPIKWGLFLKKSWLSDLEILELCDQVNCEENTQKELPKRFETENIVNQITTEPSTTT